MYDFELITKRKNTYKRPKTALSLTKKNNKKTPKLLNIRTWSQKENLKGEFLDKKLSKLDKNLYEEMNTLFEGRFNRKN